MRKEQELTSVYRNLAEKIREQAGSAECSDGECEIIQDERTYWIEYSARVESNPVFLDYDSEPDNRSKMSVTIGDWGVFDDDGNNVSTTFNPEEIEKLFDYIPNEE